MRLVLLLLLLVGLSWSVQPVGGAENAPTPPVPSVPPPSDVPPAETAPSPSDPGIVKKPEIEPLPGSVVVPPVVDPKIAVNPDEPKQQEPPAPREREHDQRQSQEQSR